MYQQLKQVVDQMTAPGQMFEIRESSVAGQTLKTWAMAPDSLRDLWLNAAEHGDKEYMVYQDERWTYTQAHEEVARIANWLSANGIKQHDRVAIAMRNYPELLMLVLAISSIGGIVVFLNAWWTTQELDYALRDSEAKVVFADGQRMERLVPLRDPLAVQRRKPRRHWLRRCAGGQDGGPEKVVPDEGEDKHAERRDGRPHQGQDDEQEDAPFRYAFDACGFDQLKGQGLDEVAHE